MLNLIIIISLLFGIFIGLNRGFILQLFHLIGFIGAFAVAVLYYDDLADRLKLWIPYQDITNNLEWAEFLQALPLETAFYSIVSFAIIFIIAKIILQIIATMLDFVASLPLLNIVNKSLGAALGFLEVYLITFVLLYVLVLAPLEFTQNLINQSFIAKSMIEHTPYFSEKVGELLRTYVAE